MTSDSKSHRVPGWLFLVGAMSAVGPFSIDMYLPGFPMIERDFAQSGVESTMAGYLIGITLGQLIYGPLSDRFGRKPPLYVGFVLYAIGSIWCSLADSMSSLLLARIAQALGACGGLVIGRAIVRDRCQPHEAARAFSILMAIIALGPVLAPSLGGWIVALFGWRAVFIFQCGIALALLLSMHVLLRESRDPAMVVPFSPPRVVRTYGRLLTDPALVGYSLAGGFLMGSLFCYVAGSPIVMHETYALSPQQFGWMLALNGLAFMSASRLNVLALRHKSTEQYLRETIWAPMLVGALLVALAMVLSLPLWATILLQFAFFISVARINPNLAALALARHGREAGAASALMGSLQSLVATLGGAVVAWLNDGSLLTLALIMTAAVICAWLTYVTTRRLAL